MWLCAGTVLSETGQRSETWYVSRVSVWGSLWDKYGTGMRIGMGMRMGIGMGMRVWEWRHENETVCNVNERNMHVQYHRDSCILDCIYSTCIITHFITPFFSFCYFHPSPPLSLSSLPLLPPPSPPSRLYIKTIKRSKYKRVPVELLLVDCHSQRMSYY